MEATLDAQKRDGRGKNEARRLRALGKLPAVVYGTQKGQTTPTSTAVTVDPKAVLRILHSGSGANTLITLNVADTPPAVVMVKEYQLDPVTHALLHTDFYELALDRLITVTVPFQLRGDAKGVKLQGGIVDFVTREIEVQCLPADIPGHLEVDISELMIGQGLRIRDLAEDPKWKSVSDTDTMIVHVVAPKAEEVVVAAEPDAAAAASAAGEPETAKRGGKPEKEGDEPAKK